MKWCPVFRVLKSISFPIKISTIFAECRMSPVADLRGREGRPPGPKFFQFHAVFGKIWQNHMLAPPGELAPPPQGNPGSATGHSLLLIIYVENQKWSGIKILGLEPKFSFELDNM